MAPPEQEVRNCLEKLLSGDRFSRSWSISRLLRFLVANALDGNSGRLKEYTLGLEVFDRGADFDPNADNIVRVQARNLRAKLEEYYAAEGSGDPIRIDFPKGGYLVHFRQIAPEAPVEAARPFPWKWIAAGVAAAAVIAVPFLWRLRSVPARNSGERHIIAVLPFTNLDHNAESDYFSDGLAEELINSLSKLQGLGVIARSSSFRFREGSRDLSQIARDLKATDVLEGSVRKRGSEIRVAVHLVDVSTSQTIWSGQYDRDLNDVLRTEEEIANGVSAALKLQLAPARANNAAAINNEAYELYLKGRYYWNKVEPIQTAKATGFFERAVQADPSFSAPYVGLAGVYGTATVMNLVPPRENWPKTKAMLVRALELDETNAEAHTLMGGVEAWYEWNYERSEVEYRRGVELGPGNVITHQYFASMLGAMGRTEEANREMDIALKLDPLNHFARWAKAQLLYWKGDLEGSKAILAQLYVEHPELPYVAQWLGLVYSDSGEHAQAIRVLEESTKRTPGNPSYYGFLGYAYGKAGQPDRARETLATLEQMSRSRFVAAIYPCYILLSLGDRKLALHYLAQACEERSMRPPWILVDRRFRELRNEPGFSKLMDHVNLTGHMQSP
jgi:TolB-like protein